MKDKIMKDYFYVFLMKENVKFLKVNSNKYKNK